MVMKKHYNLIIFIFFKFNIKKNVINGLCITDPYNIKVFLIRIIYIMKMKSCPNTPSKEHIFFFILIH